jgi:hypothetical protein
MSESTVLDVPVTDKFQSRDELVHYIEVQAGAAVDKALGGTPLRVERRVPWATSGPVGRDSGGYSVLKAAAFALGYIGPDQAKEELHVHHQLRDLYQGYGFVPHCGHQSFLVPYRHVKTMVASNYQNVTQQTFGDATAIFSKDQIAGLPMPPDVFRLLAPHRTPNL